MIKARKKLFVSLLGGFVAVVGVISLTPAPARALPYCGYKQCNDVFECEFSTTLSCQLRVEPYSCTNYSC